MDIIRYVFLFILLSDVFSPVIAAANTQVFPPHTSKAIQSFLKNSTPLSSEELKDLVVNNTIIGHTRNTHSVYELFFAKDGTLIFRKARSNQKVHVGNWWIKNNRIYSQWKTYLKKPTINGLEYYHLMGDVYVAYNVNHACGPADSFCEPFILLKGDSFGLSAYTKLQNG